MKTTDELVNEIKTTLDLHGFLTENDGDITNPELSEYLDHLLRAKGLSRAVAIKKADLSINYAYQIFSGRKHPSRDKLIRLAIGMELDLNEASRVFKLAGVNELYPRSKRDAVLMYCIEHKIPVIEIDLLLDELNLYTLA